MSQKAIPSSAKKTLFTLEYGIAGFKNLAPSASRKKIIELNRTSKSRSWSQSIHSKIKSVLQKNGALILQIGCYHSEVKQKVNLWTRGLGHFVVVLGLSDFKGPKDPFFEIEYWDPWDGQIHKAIAYEELYRDFTSSIVSTQSRNPKKSSPKIKSPTGHLVQSPYLCLLAPHLDLYSPKNYFAQRSLYALERAFG